jgi:hypothetical protein
MSVQTFAVAAVLNVTVMVVPVWRVPPFWGVVKIAPTTPADAAPGSLNADTRRVQVLPRESVTVKVLKAVPFVFELSTAMHRTANAPAVKFDPGLRVNDEAEVLCVPVPRSVPARAIGEA